MVRSKHQCPHCLVRDIALVVVAWSPLKQNGKADQNAAVALLICPRCQLPSGATLERHGGETYGHLGGVGGDPTEQGWLLNAFWPEPPKPLVPEYLPPDIERVYLQAEHNFAVQGNEEASGTMYRKALDVGLKKIDSSLTGTLVQRSRRLPIRAS